MNACSAAPLVLQIDLRISFGSTLRPSENVRLQAFEVADGEKLELLYGLLSKEDGRCLIFSRTKRGAERIAKSLNHQGIKATMIHGDRSQRSLRYLVNFCKFKRPTERISLALCGDQHLDSGGKVYNDFVDVDIAESFIPHERNWNAGNSLVFGCEP